VHLAAVANAGDTAIVGNERDTSRPAPDTRQAEPASNDRTEPVRSNNEPGTAQRRSSASAHVNADDAAAAVALQIDDLRSLLDARAGASRAIEQK
jgi:hypothetical protein